MEQIEMSLRVTGAMLKPTGNNSYPEMLEVRASGVWYAPMSDGGPAYPASIHFNVWPTNDVVPAVGDLIDITVKRHSPSIKELKAEDGHAQATSKRLDAIADLIATGNGNDLVIAKDGSVTVSYTGPVDGCHNVTTIGLVNSSSDGPRAEVGSYKDDRQ